MSYSPTNVFVEEAPSSIDRTSNQTVQQDAAQLVTGETARFKYTTWLEGDRSATLRGPSGTRAVELTPEERFTLSEAGEYEVTADGQVIDTFTVEGGPGNTAEENVGDPSDWVNQEPDTPSEYDRAVDAPGVVAGPNGPQPAPSIRDAVGDVSQITTDQGTFTFGDGDDLSIGAVAVVGGLLALAWGVLA